MTWALRMAVDRYAEWRDKNQALLDDHPEIIGAGRSRRSLCLKRLRLRESGCWG